MTLLRLSLGLLVSAGVLECFKVTGTSSSLGPSSSSTEMGCIPNYFSDGLCDSQNNNEGCGYDGGDCCACTCDPNGYYDCGDFGYACIDPEAACANDDDVTEAIASSCIPFFFSDGICDPDNNNELCGYDGGDCCSCTCDPDAYYGCGDSGYACVDPEAVCVDDDDVTEAIASSCIPSYFADGLCDPDNNNELCGYDEGDCCSCTCDPNGYYDCGEFGYDCIDPEAACVDDDDGVTENVASSCVPAFSSNGFCDPDNNNELCGYDGGDCCSCTCAAGDYHECGEAGFDCIDPEAPCVDLTTADPNSAAKSLTSATFIATFTAGLGVMHLVNLFS